MLFLSSLILTLAPLIAEVYYPRLIYFSRDMFKIPLLELVEESRIVIEELSAFPSGLKIACKMSPNSAGI
jgi:hypothetical protein